MSRKVHTAGSARNQDFTLHINDDNTWSTDQIQIALLADIRAELRRLNQLLHCSNFTGIPHTLRRIDKRAAKHLPLKEKKGG